MTKFLVKHFVKDYQNTKDLAVRTSYGSLASIVGIACNLLLFTVKFVVGLVLNSVSVTADAFNNFSDAGSSIIGLVGVRMAGKPADKDHPFGHGRIEYIAALIVAFLVIEVGFTFLKDSFSKIFHPEELVFKLSAVLILVLSIAVKLWLGHFNRTLGKRIDSKVMLATAADATGDAITTGVTILSIVIFYFFHINVDGYVGILVAAIVMWAGIGIARDTLEPLIGAPVDPALAGEITSLVESYDGILGTHDLIVHNYGPGRSIASIHAEVPKDTDVEKSHETIDRAEREVSKKLGLLLVIHMDPVDINNPKLAHIKEELEAILQKTDPALTYHDLRMVDGENQINLIFDLVVPADYPEDQAHQLTAAIMAEISALDKRYQCVITIDKSFVSKE